MTSRAERKGLNKSGSWSSNEGQDKNEEHKKERERSED